MWVGSSVWPEPSRPLSYEQHLPLGVTATLLFTQPGHRDGLGSPTCPGVLPPSLLRRWALDTTGSDDGQVAGSFLLEGRCPRAKPSLSPQPPEQPETKPEVSLFEDFERTPSGRIRRTSAQVAVFHLQEIAEDELAKDWTKRRMKDDLVPETKRVRASGGSGLGWGRGWRSVGARGLAASQWGERVAKSRGGGEARQCKRAVQNLVELSPCATCVLLNWQLRFHPPSVSRWWCSGGVEIRPPFLHPCKVSHWYSEQSISDPPTVYTQQCAEESVWPVCCPCRMSSACVCWPFLLKLHRCFPNPSLSSCPLMLGMEKMLTCPPGEFSPCGTQRSFGRGYKIQAGKTVERRPKTSSPVQ